MSLRIRALCIALSCVAPFALSPTAFAAEDAAAKIGDQLATEPVAEAGAEPVPELDSKPTPKPDPKPDAKPDIKPAAEPTVEAVAEVDDEGRELESPLAGAIKQHTAGGVLLERLNGLIGQVDQACIETADARKRESVTRRKAVEAARKVHALPAEAEDALAFQALRAQAEDAYRKAHVRLVIENASLRRYLKELEKSQHDLSGRNISEEVRDNVSKAIEQAIENLRREIGDDSTEARPIDNPKEPPAETNDQPAAFDPSGKVSSQRTIQREQYFERHVDSFFRQPLVSNIPPAECLDDFAQPASDDSNDSTRFLDDCLVLDYRFDHPARFPLPAWGLNHEYLERPGVLIYEGMRLAIRPDGRYQVRFTIGAPAMPVTLQIQFDLMDHCTGQAYTLTLPPITIPPECKPTAATAGQAPKAAYENLQTIHHEGYLPILDGYPQSESIHVVRRTGTARFGYGVRVP